MEWKMFIRSLGHTLAPQIVTSTRTWAKILNTISSIREWLTLSGLENLLFNHRVTVEFEAADSVIQAKF